MRLVGRWGRVLGGRGNREAKKHNECMQGMESTSFSHGIEVPIIVVG